MTPLSASASYGHFASAGRRELHLSAARSGSQTLLFTPLAPTLSIALPSDGVHLPRVKMSLRGTERCTALLQSIGENALNGSLPLSS